ncbi:MAG: thiosulfate oxidation carrier complex protein SoxZ [Methylomonas sp.]|nr:MAG: thiosulfate oxidation carrier complex protein SoxZ [Methylomonas sp.]
MSIKIRTQRFAEYTEIKLLLSHPMENGRNRDPNGQLIPAHFIRELTLELNDKTVVNANLGGSMSKDPFFTFRLKSTVTGDRLRIRWLDNHDLSDQAEHVIE